MNITDNISVRDYVWFVQPGTYRIVHGKVYHKIAKDPFPQSPYLIVGGDTKDPTNGFIGSYSIPIEECFATKEECQNFRAKNSKSIVISYELQINNVEDLLRFPLEHSFGTKECIDYEAIQAYKERAKELGFDLENLEKEPGK